MDFHPQWSGVGPDGGRDLLFDEQGLAVLGRKMRTWLVSCKDKSGSGTAVGVEDLEPVVDVTRQHGAQGYLLVCTTHPSAAVVERLRTVERNSAGTLVTHYWDSVILERLLSTPRMWAIAQQFMPVSAGAAGWRVFGTDKPNQWVAVHRGHHFHLSKRVGGNDSFDFESLDRRIDELEALEHDGRRFRLRGVWLDDAKGGGFTWYVDCMAPFGEPLPDASTIRRFLRDGWTREDGQSHHFDIAVHAIDWYRDHFDMDHYDYYERLPSFV